jgi:hypothetical protein
MTSYNFSTINPDPDEGGCPPVDTPVSGIALTDTEAMDLIAREMSGEEWDADTCDVIAAYVRGTGREIATVEVWTLTVDAHDGKAIVTTVHTTEADAQRCLFANYDPHGIYSGDVQQCIDDECLTVHIEAHKIVLP